MSSFIPGYEFDIFISYRQKDNKKDGWVTDFVENLQGELEATFKNEISVYFDSNPHDGLLETHDVDESLKIKLRSLIFLPVLSRTYCDPKSFAWNHEFKAFIEQASKDSYGLKIALQKGNIASRVLPIRINDLDQADTEICESLLGGVLRPVDFIYKEPGVNRPLRWNEENSHNNLNGTIYRNQINKVALSIRDLIEGISMASSSVKHDTDLPSLEPGKKIYQKTTTAVNNNLDKAVTRLKIHKKLFQSRYLVSGITLIAAILALMFFLHRKAKIEWAYNEALPKIGQLINKGNILDAYSLAKKAGEYIPNDSKLKELAALVTSKITIITDPQGAEAYIREYGDTIREWKRLGTTPIVSAEIAGGKFYLTSAFYLVKLEKAGYENVITVECTEQDSIYRKLFQKGTIPEGMIFVDKYWNELTNSFSNNPFFMDRYEVTNKQYKKFIVEDGYRNPDFWKNKFIQDGKEIPREEAMKLFIDRTGRPGPATWEAGDYPDGQDSFPVSGVSWYEAAAFADYAGKSLPTCGHWDSGTGWYLHQPRFLSALYDKSNFSNKGPLSVGSKDNATFFGAFDMAGNVKEWVSNESTIGHVTCGGGWNDYSYRYGPFGQLPSMDRSPQNGFRCVKYIEPKKIPLSAFSKVVLNSGREYMNEKPADDEEFRIYRNMFLYDNADLNAKIELVDDAHEDWTIQKISFNAAYDDEKVIAYMYLPKNASPPFQVLVFFPGTGATISKNLVNDQQTNWFIDYILKSGRAVLFPVYNGTFERKGDPVKGARNYSEYLKKCILDFRRSVDYIVTRTDIDTSKMGYYGHSWGGRLGGIIPAVENRIKLSILILGGMGANKDFPMTDAINYVSRIRVPVLMLNGKYDYAFNYEKSVLPFYKLLGTAEKDKHLVVYDTDHYIAKDEMIKEVLAWLDKYFGPVN